MISKLIKQAYDSAKIEMTEGVGSRSKEVNSARSKRWIECLANELRKHYKLPSYRVFSSGHQSNRKTFKINELLYDISVVKVETISSANNNKKLEYVECCEWLIESEFHRHDSRASIIDFSKLIMGRAKNKLLILPESKTISTWALTEFKKAVPEDGDNYYLAFIAHPNDWPLSNSAYRLFVFRNREWIEIS